MFKKNPILILVITLFSISLVIASQLYVSNSALKAEITQKQEDTTKRIDKLEAMLAKAEKEVAEKKPNPSKTEKPLVISEDELLKNFFAGTPNMISGGTSPTKVEIPKTGPVLTVTPEVFDFGTIKKQDGSVEANYELKNDGTSDLIISYAFTSCGCTVTPIKDEVVLAPGETYQLDVSYDPNFYGPGYELGDVEKSVTILSNYSANSFYKVKLKANISP